MELIPNRPTRRCAGFTLVELIITLAIASILLTVGVPALRDFAINQRVKTTAFELVASLSNARSEAIKRNADAILQAATVGGKPGWVLQVGGTNLRTYTIPDNVEITVGTSSVTFGPDGRSDSSVVFQICDANDSASVTRRTVRLDISGRPSLTRGGNCAS